jgi:hypothetical protein
VLRFSVVGSILVHCALVALAANLPLVPTVRVKKPIEFDIRAAAPQPKPELPKPEEPKPEPKPLVKPASLVREKLPLPSMMPKPDEPKASAPEPPKAEATPPPQEPQRRPPVDLRLRALPTMPTAPGGSGVEVPSGAAGGTFGTAAPRKEWKPRGDAGDPILGKVKDKAEDRFPLERVGRDEYVYNGPQFSAHINNDGSVSFDDKIIRDFKGTSGSFDITDMIMKGRGEDPYRHEKKRFMEHTDKLRAELAKKARAERLQASLAQLPAHLDDVWLDRRYSVKRRRALIGEIWCDVDVKDGAEGARTIVEKYIRKNLPEGTEDAYTDDEMETLGRRCKAPFKPYQ